MDFVFEMVKKYASTNVGDNMEMKALFCCAINGFGPEEVNSLHRWNRNYDPEKTVDIVYKRQYFHSSAAIYMALVYPEMIKDQNNFANLIDTEYKRKSCLKLATEILKSDPDGVDFINNIGSTLQKYNNVVIVDDNNAAYINVIDI